MVFNGPAFEYFHRSRQRFLVYGQKKKWTVDFNLPQEQVAR